MIRGLYAVGSGLMTQEKVLNVAASNIANVNTPGYKRDTLLTTTFGQQLAVRLQGGQTQQSVGTISLGRVAQVTTTVGGQGDLNKTDRSLDLAISGEGMFTIQTAGGLRYTRDGQFGIDPQGYLYSDLGGRVMGLKGPIKVDGNVTINSKGEVFSGNTYLDTLRVHVPTNYANLTNVGNGLFSDRTAADGQFGGSVMQGFLEMSNVDMTKEMTGIMASSRNFQSCSQIVKILDGNLQKAVSEIGRV